MAAFAPNGTPKEIIARLNAAIGKALALPDVRTDVRTRLREIDLVAAPSFPGELERAIRADIYVNRDLAKNLGLRLV